MSVTNGRQQQNVGADYRGTAGLLVSPSSPDVPGAVLPREQVIQEVEQEVIEQLQDIDAADLDLGTMATQNANNVDIENGQATLAYLKAASVELKTHPTLGPQFDTLSPTGLEFLTSGSLAAKLYSSGGWFFGRNPASDPGTNNLFTSGRLFSQGLSVGVSPATFTPNAAVHLDGSPGTEVGIKFTQGATSPTSQGFKVALRTDGHAELRTENNRSIRVFTNGSQRGIFQASGTFDWYGSFRLGLSTGIRGIYLKNSIFNGRLFDREAGFSTIVSVQGATVGCYCHASWTEDAPDRRFTTQAYCETDDFVTVWVQNVSRQRITIPDVELRLLVIVT